MQISEQLAQALPASALSRIRSRFHKGDWGRCNIADKAAHAFRDGLLLLACYQCNGVRVHIVTDEERTFNRAVMADE